MLAVRAAIGCCIAARCAWCSRRRVWLSVYVWARLAPSDPELEKGAGVSKSSFLIVQGLHGVGEERAEVRPGVLTNRLLVPGANLQGELYHIISLTITGIKL